MIRFAMRSGRPRSRPPNITHQPHRSMYLFMSLPLSIPNALRFASTGVSLFLSVHSHHCHYECVYQNVCRSPHPSGYLRVYVWYFYEGIVVYDSLRISSSRPCVCSCCISCFVVLQYPLTPSSASQIHLFYIRSLVASSFLSFALGCSNIKRER